MGVSEINFDAPKRGAVVYSDDILWKVVASQLRRQGHDKCRPLSIPWCNLEMPLLAGSWSVFIN